MEVTLTEADRNAIIDELERRFVKDSEDKWRPFRDELLQRLHRSAEARVHTAIETAIDQVGEERVRPVVDKILEEGWQRTDEYGRPTGAVETVKDRLGAFFKRGRYATDKGVALRLIDDAISQELKQEILEAKRKIRAMLNEAVFNEVRDAVYKALGIDPKKLGGGA